MATTSNTSALRTRQEICEELGISRSTLYRRCREHGIRLGRKVLISPEVVKRIYRTFGCTNG